MTTNSYLEMKPHAIFGRALPKTPKRMMRVAIALAAVAHVITPRVPVAMVPNVTDGFYMEVLVVGKFPPIQGGVSAGTYWTAQELARLGHRVTVLTNAAEVEWNIREVFLVGDAISWQDSSFLDVHSTSSTRQFNYLPWAEPYATKLLGLGLEIISRRNFDVILGYYLEPYGVVAAQLASESGVPLVLRHAGSDIGRLASHAQLHNAYTWALRKASTILSTRGENIRNALEALGVQPANIQLLQGSQLPSMFSAEGSVLDVNENAETWRRWAETLPLSRDITLGLETLNGKSFDPKQITIGVYGKVGKVKGTYALLDALANIAKQGVSFQLLWLAGGGPSEIERFYRAILSTTSLQSRAWVLPFLPPWRIPSFLRACSVVCFLEHQFPITFHTSSIPREILSTGRCLVCSDEMARKLYFGQNLVDGVNVNLVSDPGNLADLTQRLMSLVQDPSCASSLGRRGLEMINAYDEFADEIDSMARVLLRSSVLQR
jgi:glycosyltransferase involved in cell wall biosynthesis